MFLEGRNTPKLIRGVHQFTILSHLEVALMSESKWDSICPQRGQGHKEVQLPLCSTLVVCFSLKNVCIS